MIQLKRLKEIISFIEDADIPNTDELEIFIRNSINPLGKIDGLEQVELSTRAFFGEDIPCIILNTVSSKDLEMTLDDEIIDYINKD